MKICVSRFCHYTEEFSLTSTRVEGPSEGKSFTTDHSKQKHLGPGRVQGAYKDYRLPSNVNWEKAEKSGKNKAPGWSLCIGKLRWTVIRVGVGPPRDPRQPDTLSLQ